MALKLVSNDDYIAIANIMGAYQHMVDEGDEEGYASLFTEDGEFIGLSEEVAPAMPTRGHEGLKQIPRITHQFFGGKYRHHMGSFTASYGATTDEAYARYYILATSWLAEQGPKMETFALVKTHLVRIDGEWKIKTNAFTPL